MVVEVVSWLSRMAISWITSESHSYVDLLSQMRTAGIPCTLFNPELDADRYWKVAKRSQVSSFRVVVLQSLTINYGICAEPSESIEMLGHTTSTGLAFSFKSKLYLILPYLLFLLPVLE